MASHVEADISTSELPIVDWLDLATDKPKFLEDLRHALANVGFCVLVNHPDFVDANQKRWFSTVRQFFEASDDEKATADISLSPYFRGWSKDKRAMQGKIPSLLAQEAYQYGFDQERVADPHDQSVPIYKRLFKGVYSSRNYYLIPATIVFYPSHLRLSPPLLLICYYNYSHS